MNPTMPTFQSKRFTNKPIMAGDKFFFNRNNAFLFLAFGLLTLLALSFSGCQLNSFMSVAPEGEGEEKNKVIELEFWTLQLGTFDTLLKPMFAQYEREHPGIKIRWVDVPFSEGPKRALTAMMSSKVPDVVNLNPDFSAVLASRHAVVNMNEYVVPSIRSKYLPVSWKASSIGNYTFGLPWYLTSSVTLYNQSLLEKAGMKEPPKTYDEIKLLAQRLGKQGYAVMPSISESGNFFKELQKAGIPLFKTLSTHPKRKIKAIFDSPEASAKLNFWVDLYQKKLIPAESITEGHRAAVDRYQSGTLALLLVGPNFLNIVKENAPKIFSETGVAPQFPPGGTFKEFSCMVLVVPRQSAHPKEAVEFALFMTNAQNQLALAQKAPVLPSVLEALDSPYFQKITSSDLVERARSISAKQLMEATEAYQIQAKQQQLNEIMNFHVQRALLGKESSAQALHLAATEINNLLQ
jgi:putative chitobiose transport system substrate-binding protein